MQINRKYHYFYKITNNINGHFYYGVHNTDKLDDGYMGSGKRLHLAYEKYGMENFTKEILKFFDSSAEAFEYEAKVVNEILVSDPNCYNCTNGGFYWNTKGLTPVRDKDGNCFAVSVNDPRYLSGELVGVTKGLATVRDKDGNCFDVPVNDPRYLSGELVGVTKGYGVYISTITGEYIKTTKDDPRYLSGEITGTWKNKIFVRDSKDNTFLVDKNDPRYLSGELKFICCGHVVVKDKCGNYYQVSKDDPRYLSGELKGTFYGRKHKDETKEKLKKIFKEIHHQQGEKNSQYGKCWIHKDKVNKTIKKNELEFYLSEGWIKGRKMKF